MGGRQVISDPEYGQSYDHFAVDYEFPNGLHVMSMARQIEGCESNVSETIVGTKGQWHSGGYRLTPAGTRVASASSTRSTRTCKSTSTCSRASSRISRCAS